MDNQIIPKLCGNKMAPYMTYNDCGSGLYTLIFEDGTFVINLPEEKLFEYGLIHGAVMESFEPFIDPYDYIFIYPEDRPWVEWLWDVTAIEVASVIQPIDMSYWFMGMDAAETVDLSLVDTSQTQFMMYTFSDCTTLNKIDLSTFDTSALVSPYLMFYHCTNVEELDLSNWTFNDNTKYAWEMVYVGTRQTIPNITSFKLNNVDTSNVTDMERMFNNLRWVETLDLSSFDTSNVTTMSQMFTNGGFTELDLSTFDTSKVTNMGSMFYDCRSLASIDVSSFDTSMVEYMFQMFALTDVAELYLCSFTGTNLEDAYSMFAYCSNLETIYTTPLFDLTSLQEGSNMFYLDGKLVGGMGTVYDSNYISSNRAKIDGGIGNEGYFTAC